MVAVVTTQPTGRFDRPLAPALAQCLSGWPKAAAAAAATADRRQRTEPGDAAAAAATAAHPSASILRVAVALVCVCMFVSPGRPSLLSSQTDRYYGGD